MLELKKFWSPSCGPCRMLGPIVEKVLTDYPSIKLVDINTDDDMKEGGENVKKYGVRSIPAVFIEKDGEVVEKFLGVKTEQELRQIFDSIEN
jgi:thioredoxin-like negative regulator of GroEL